MSGDSLMWVLLHGLGDDGAGLKTLQRRLKAHGHEVVRPDIHRAHAAASGDLRDIAMEIHSKLCMLFQASLLLGPAAQPTDSRRIAGRRTLAPTSRAMGSAILYLRAATTATPLTAYLQK